jgi:hypothetical protein
MNTGETTQIVLDPRKVTAADVWIPTGPVPPEMRAFGAFPNAEQWMPGDVVLLSEVAPSREARTIVAAQREAGYSDEHAQWHDAVIYLGNGLVCELVAGGVRPAQLYDYVRSCLMRVRRDDTLDIGVRWAIAMNALTAGLIRNSVFDTLTNSVQRLLGTSRAIFSSGVAENSAQLYADSYARATRRPLGPLKAETRAGAITPAFLSETRQLVDAPLHWLQLRSPVKPSPKPSADDSTRQNTAALSETGAVLNAYSALENHAPSNELGSWAEELERLKAHSPTSRMLYIVLGRLYRRRGDLERAIGVLTEFVKNKETSTDGADKDVATALYNRACYYVQKARDVGAPDRDELINQAFADLAAALGTSPELSGDATQDPDLEGLRSDERFQQIVQPLMRTIR